MTADKLNLPGHFDVKPDMGIDDRYTRKLRRYHKPGPLKER